MLKIARGCWHIIVSIMQWFRSSVLKNKISDETWNTFVQFVKFGLVGFSNTVISYATYYILVPLGCNKYVASAIGFLLSIVNAYYWNNCYVFKKHEDEERSHIKAFVKLLLSYAGTGLVLANLLLWLWTDYFSFSVYIAPIINLFITIPVNFILNKFWAFSYKKRGKNEEIRNNDSLL